MTRSLHILVLGPLFYIKHNWKISVGLLALIVLLTILTQVGRLILWMSLLQGCHAARHDDHIHVQIE